MQLYGTIMGCRTRWLNISVKSSRKECYTLNSKRLGWCVGPTVLSFNDIEYEIWFRSLLQALVVLVLTSKYYTFSAETHDVLPLFLNQMVLGLKEHYIIANNSVSESNQHSNAHNCLQTKTKISNVSQSNNWHIHCTSIFII